MPPVTFDANGVLLHGRALFERHINNALRLASRKNAMAAGFAAELISVESTRCGATFEALSSLAPAIHGELDAAYKQAVVRLRDIRFDVLDALKAPEGKADEHGVAPVDLTA